MEKWEFQSVLFDVYKGKYASLDERFLLEKDMFESLGSEGWELVSVVPITETKEPDATHTSQIYFYFKRPLIT